MGKLIGKTYATPAPAAVAPAAAAGAAAAVQPPAVFACPHCGKEYKTEKGLADHIAKEHADAPAPDGE